MSGYTPYLISEFKTGINNYLQPWKRPADAFEPLVNAYINRGTINKRAGYSQYGDTVADGNPIMGIMTFINATTGIRSLLVATTVHLYLYNAGSNTFGAIALLANFTGNITNFFNWTNWQASSGATAYLYMVNNKDALTLFDGTVSSQPTITIDAAAHTITTALDVKVYKQRLLLIKPTRSDTGIQNQAIYWSKIQNPTNWLIDTAGNGGFSEAPTGDIIQSAKFIRDVLVVFFRNSTWIFRYTGNQNDPFRWDKVNDSKAINCPYGSIEYDERCTAIGSTGLVACDGVNVQRYDIPIVDYYETNMSEEYYAQSFGLRYDNLNQGWMLYVSNGSNNPLVGSVAPGSDKALIYNFLENSFSTYSFSDAMTCLGTFFNQTGTTWADLTQAWDDTDVAWKSYSNQKAAPILLCGDTSGHVWRMDDQNNVKDNATSFSLEILSTRWNPVMEMGQKVQFGWIDIYYYIASLDADNPIEVTLNFYTDNSLVYALSKTLTLDGPVGSEYAMKRIYLNLTGEFIQMEIDPNEDSFIQFVGFVLWARPAGRWTP